MLDMFLISVLAMEDLYMYVSLTGTRHGYLRWTDICCDARFDIINRPFLVDGTLIVLQVCACALEVCLLLFLFAHAQVLTTHLLKGNISSSHEGSR